LHTFAQLISTCVKKLVVLFFFIAFNSTLQAAENSQNLINKGWELLVVDNDTAALRYFNNAFQLAKQEKNQLTVAEALLDMGICTYGVSYTNGLSYCLRALDEYKKLESTNPKEALTGRCKCLQLISTIKSRQGKYRESISLSKAAQAGFAAEKDTSGYVGLIYNSLGIAYSNLGNNDSAAYFHRAALQERLLTKNFTYLPGSYVSVAQLEIKAGNKIKSEYYLQRALKIADSTGNRQAQVAALLAMSDWQLSFNNSSESAENTLLKAIEVAEGLSDKYFYLNSLKQFRSLKKQQNKLGELVVLDEKIENLKDSLASWERMHITKSLEIQFHLSEKERELNTIQSEKNIATLTNYLLWSIIVALLLLGIAIVVFLKRINTRNKLLLTAQNELMKATAEQKKLKEQQLKNELEHKESQLSALTLQMLQKNELMLELKSKLDESSASNQDSSLQKIIAKGMNHDKEWNDFNSSFESLNKNFYARLKQAYPEISPNDLKLCALIKMNLSIKEMAGILNISPDSVKTARYRLRKKLQLSTEENLTDFILHLNN